MALILVQYTDTSGKPSLTIVFFYLKFINLDQRIENFELEDFTETMATEWD